MSSRTGEQLAGYFESGFVLEFVAVVTGALYFVGSGYVGAYFERLGISHKALDLPYSYYLTETLFPLSVLAVGILVWLLSRGSERPTSRLGAAWGNLPAFVFAGLVAYRVFSGEVDQGRLEYWVSVVSCACILVIALVLSWRRVSGIYYLMHAGPGMRLAGLLAVVALAAYAAAIMGAASAVGLIEGVRTPSFAIEFHWREGVFNELQQADSQFALILYRNGNYYVLPRETPAPKLPKVYVVPEEQTSLVISARTK